MNGLLAVLGTLAAIATYFAPAIIGGRRRVANQGSVIVVNLLLGWTVIGWIVALAMALRTTTRPPPQQQPRGPYGDPRYAPRGPRG
jgi:Superinfection immunity protein